jgi:hypothetical protein
MADDTTNSNDVPAGVTFDPPTTSATDVPAGVTLDAPVQKAHWYDAATHELGELNTGFTSALSQTGLTAQKAIGSIPVVGPAFTAATADARAADTARAAQPMNTPGRVAGNVIENILEFAAGDEALKGASVVNQIKTLEPIAKALKAHPELVRVVGNSIRQGTVGTAQSLAHGNDLPTALKTGAAAAVGGAAAEGAVAGAGKIVQAVAPSTAEALGETIPVLASQQPGASPIAKEIAAIGSEPGYATAQQAGAQRGIVNRAQQAAKNVLDDINSARQNRWVSGEADFNPATEAETPPAAPDRQLPSGQAQLPAETATSGQPQLEAGTPPASIARTNEVGAFEGDIPESAAAASTSTDSTATQPAASTPPRRVSFIEERPPNFQPIDSDAEVQNIRSFGDAADKIREHAAPVYARLDSVTNGDFTNLQRTLSDAYNDQDYAKVRDTEDAIDDLFNRPAVRNSIDRADYITAKNAWRSSKILDAVHAATSRAFNISDAGLAEDSGVWRGVSGAKLMGGINRLVERYGRSAIENVIGSDGLTGLTKIASITQTPRNAAMYGQVVGDVANEVGNMAARSGVVSSSLNWARKLVLHSAATNPIVNQYLDYAARNNVSSRVFAPLIAATINQSLTRKAPTPPQQ